MENVTFEGKWSDTPMECPSSSVDELDAFDERSPSVLDGLGILEETNQRVFGCDIIADAFSSINARERGGVKALGVSVSMTAMAIFHRFFWVRSLTRYDPFTVAMGSFLLASKVEESPRILREIILTFHAIYLKRKGLPFKELDVGGRFYNDWKTELIKIERFLLKDIGFSLYEITDHPHRFILYVVKVLHGSKELTQSAWNYLSDSMRLGLFVQHSPQLLAAAAIYLSARTTTFPLPSSPPWWVILDLDVEDEECVLALANEMMALYRLPRSEHVAPLMAVSYLDAYDQYIISIKDKEKEKEKDAR